MPGCRRPGRGQTIASQTAALRVHAQRLGLEVPDEWVFEDEGHSGATLVRPALERLRDLVAGVGIDVVLCYSPDRSPWVKLLSPRNSRTRHATESASSSSERSSKRMVRSE